MAPASEAGGHRAHYFGQQRRSFLDGAMPLRLPIGTGWLRVT